MLMLILVILCWRCLYSLSQEEGHREGQSPAQHRLGAVRPKPGPTFFHSKKSRQKMHRAPGTLAQNPFTIKKDRPENSRTLKQFRA